MAFSFTSETIDQDDFASFTKPVSLMDCRKLPKPVKTETDFSFAKAVKL